MEVVYNFQNISGGNMTADQVRKTIKEFEKCTSNKEEIHQFCQKLWIDYHNYQLTIDDD
ncbi:hypothetical protein DICPUDRAFT_153278 [Dictyostelium purpureum]|uniref:Uncharacterized protein n=1 Tax=Dictyostelium purpureum TaxID=5786 RepID=F0ZNH6_DICPU|nr:uncharacterized protein DICPUDRAFT_153278 [Dictyostelium purpureum]EGC34534.1 hypothetical protein DICPUDRAFT_153278 [Dictyostelium purpureum]|eukprot:XP_003288970.1 hypothetical protein DICPUDRAFT_153278 [Dictyostelium purpureum]